MPFKLEVRFSHDHALHVIARTQCLLLVRLAKPDLVRNRPNVSHFEPQRITTAGPHEKLPIRAVRTASAPLKPPPNEPNRKRLLLADRVEPHPAIKTGRTHY